MGTSPRSSRVWSSLWFIPVLCVLAGVLVSIGTIAVDRATGFELIPRWLTGGPDAAMGILTTIAVSMVSLATLVLTITMVVVQLAMGQFSPRIVQTFLRDKPSQLAIGLFVATFAHTMLAMREVQFDGDGQVPGIAIAVGYVLVLTSIAMLVMYVHHIGRSLRVSALIELVGNDTRRLLEQVYPEVRAGEPDEHEIVAPRSGVLTAVDRRRLVDIATAAGCTLHVVPAVGGFVPAGAPLIRIEGDPHDLDRKGALARCIRDWNALSTRTSPTGSGCSSTWASAPCPSRRSLTRRPPSSASTGSTTGFASSPIACLPDGRLHDAEGHLRLTVPAMSWDAYVHLAFDEIRLAGAHSPQVSRRLVAALGDLLEMAPVERRPGAG